MFILSVIMIVQMLFFGIMMADLENIADNSFDLCDSVDCYGDTEYCI